LGLTKHAANLSIPNSGVNKPILTQTYLARRQLHIPDELSGLLALDHPRLGLCLFSFVMMAGLANRGW